MEEANRLQLSGTVINIHGTRHAPSGVPHFRFQLEHRSRQVEAGVPREVKCRIEVEARGQALVAQAARLSQGDRVLVSGFLSRRSFKDQSESQLVFHVQTLTGLAADGSEQH